MNENSDSNIRPTTEIRATGSAKEYIIGNYLNIALLIIVALSALYIFSMVISPFYKTSLNWEKVQNIWDRWQTFNAAMIALVASLIAIASTVYKERKDNRRNLFAAKAVLSHTLSDISDYVETLGDIYAKRYPMLLRGTKFDAIPQPDALPVLNEEYLSTFKDVIKHCRESHAKHLLRILTNLQVIRSRSRDYFPQKTGRVVTHENIRAEIITIAETLYMIDETFDFARDFSDLNYTALTEEQLIKQANFYFRLNLQKLQ